MAGTVKKLQFSEGTDVGAPTDLSLATSTTDLSVYVDDAAYVSANGAAANGNVYINSTLNAVRYYSGGSWRTGASLTGTEVFTNKDYDGGTASNTSRITLPKASTSTISGLTRKQGTIHYDTTLNVPTFDDGSSVVALATSAAAQDAPIDLKNYSIACSVSSNALTIALKDKAGSNPSVGSPVSFAFRNATTATGDYTIVTATSATSLVISSGSTLGHSSATQGYIYVYAFNNGGTLVLGASTSLVDCYSVQSTTAEGGAGAADSATTIYTSSALTSKACRFIARLSSTQTTAGTWASAPTEISLSSGLLPYRFQYKSLASNYTGANPATAASDLTFSNLVAGRAYRITVTVLGDTSSWFWVQWGSGGASTNYAACRYTANQEQTISRVFISDGTAVKTYYGSGTWVASDSGQTPTALTGGNPKVNFAVLEELNGMTETAAYA